MYEIIATGVSIVEYDTEDDTPYVATQVFRLEFDTYEDMIDAISGLEKARGCANSERLRALP